MGRPLKSKIFALALSPTMAAAQLNVPTRKVREALLSGELVAYDGGGKRVRILVVDLLQWVHSTWPRAVIRKKLREMS